MNVGQIKRFVNDGLVPVNRLIGSPSDTENNNTVYGLQKKILTGISDVKDSIAEVKEIVSTGSDGYYLPSNSETDKLFSGYGGTVTYIPKKSNTVRAGGCWAFIPKYDGVVQVKFIRGNANLAVIFNVANIFSVPFNSIVISSGQVNYKKTFSPYLEALRHSLDVEISNTGGIYDQITNDFNFTEQLISSQLQPAYIRNIEVKKGIPVMMVIQYTNNYSDSSQKIDTTQTGFEVFGKVKNFIV